MDAPLASTKVYLAVLDSEQTDPGLVVMPDLAGIVARLFVGARAIWTACEYSIFVKAVTSVGHDKAGVWLP